MSLETTYAKLLAKITEPVYDVRDLVVVDENYDDIDTDEFDVFDPEDYNFIVYVTERVQEAMGKERLPELIEKLDAHKAFTTFFAPEEDMYGLWSELDEEAVTHEIVKIIEEDFM